MISDHHVRSTGELWTVSKPPTMTCGEDIPESIQYQIVSMRCTDMEFPSIAKEMKVKTNTAQKIYYNWLEKENCTNMPRLGRPRKLDEHHILRIKSIFRRTEKLTTYLCKISQSNWI